VSNLHVNYVCVQRTRGTWRIGLRACDITNCLASGGVVHLANSVPHQHGWEALFYCILTTKAIAVWREGEQQKLGA
jgi:hypothetical protein